MYIVRQRLRNNWCRSGQNPPTTKWIFCCPQSNWPVNMENEELLLNILKYWSINAYLSLQLSLSWMDYDKKSLCMSKDFYCSCVSASCFWLSLCWTCGNVEWLHWLNWLHLWVKNSCRDEFQKLNINMSAIPPLKTISILMTIIIWCK